MTHVSPAPCLAQRALPLPLNLSSDAAENSIMQTITIAVSAILIAAGLVTAPGLINNARDSNARNDLANLAYAQEEYSSGLRADDGTYGNLLAGAPLVNFADASGSDYAPSIAELKTNGKVKLTTADKVDVRMTVSDDRHSYLIAARSSSGHTFYRGNSSANTATTAAAVSDLADPFAGDTGNGSGDGSSTPGDANALACSTAPKAPDSALQAHFDSAAPYLTGSTSTTACDGTSTLFAFSDGFDGSTSNISGDDTHEVTATSGSTYTSHFRLTATIHATDDSPIASQFDLPVLRNDDGGEATVTCSTASTNLIRAGQTATLDCSATLPVTSGSTTWHWTSYRHDFASEDRIDAQTGDLQWLDGTRFTVTGK